MAAIIKPTNKASITTRMSSISPYELYIEQVRSISDSIRINSKGLTYIPPQFGGIKGQLAVLNDQAVVQMVDFENNT